tara:strand:- start:960 stop:1493 length:534 start_codon:yes stop_codon:yes gene_type:complete
MPVRQRRIAKKIEEKVKLYWPSIRSDELWTRKTDGFTSIPRTMPIVLNIIDDLTKGQPASSTYFELWCRAFDEMFVSLEHREQQALMSGFSGQRAERTWSDRVKALVELGFLLGHGTEGRIQRVLIPNPHLVIERMYREKAPGLSNAQYILLRERAIDIGADDVGVDPRTDTEDDDD